MHKLRRSSCANLVLDHLYVDAPVNSANMSFERFGVRGQVQSYVRPLGRGIPHVAGQGGSRAGEILSLPLVQKTPGRSPSWESGGEIGGSGDVCTDVDYGRARRRVPIVIGETVQEMDGRVEVCAGEVQAEAMCVLA